MQRFIAAAALLALVAPAAAADPEAPPWNIGGKDWVCIEQCEKGYAGRPTEIVQDRQRFTLIDELGRKQFAQWMGANQIAFIGCDNNATLSADLRRLEFTFGQVWVR